MDEKKLKNAQNVYESMCAMLEDNNMKFARHDEDMVVTFMVGGDDIPMEIIMNIDAERELVRILSPVPVIFDEEKRLEGAIATCHANYNLADGSFDYDFKKGTVFFRMTSSFKDSLVSKEVFEYMLGVAIGVVDDLNDQFLLLAKDRISLEDFIKNNC